MSPSRRRQESLRFDELYIEPVGVCNLDCRVCYTDRSAPTRLSTEDMLNFALKQDAYERQYDPRGLRYVYFCGTGELFVLKYFPDTLRAFHDAFPKAVLQVQTNGTFPFPDLDFPVDWNISIDGTQKYHEMNRGKGTFRPTIRFLESALKNRDEVMVRTIVGRWNEENIPRFARWLRDNYGLVPEYERRMVIPRNGFGPLTKRSYTHEDELGVPSERWRKTYVVEPKEIRPGACHQVSIFHGRRVTFCCEAPIMPAHMDMSMLEIEDVYINIMGPCRQCHVNTSCWWCIKPSFNCGMQEVWKVNSCKDVAQQIADRELVTIQAP